MRKLIVNEPGCFLGVKEERIQVKKENRLIAEIPAIQLTHIYLCTRGATLSSAALRLLLKHGVNLIILDGQGRPLGRLLPIIRKGLRTVEEQIKALNDNRGLVLAKAFALSKVLNQYSILKSMAYNRDNKNPILAKEVHKAARDVKDYSGLIEKIEAKNLEKARAEIMRLEAEAAEIYWRCIANIMKDVVDFPGRRKRFDNPKDPMNLLLNYGYGVLASHCTLALELSGLDPYRGFLHVNNPRRPALAMDLMEEFRQTIVDRVVFRVIRETRGEGIVGDEGLNREARRLLLVKLNERFKERVTFNNRSLSLENHILLQARRIQAYLLGYEANYKPYIEK